MMKISDFKKYINIHGADLSRWPQHEIRPAVDLIQRDPEAGKIFSTAEKFDQMLRYYPPASINVNALAGRIIQQARRGTTRAKSAVAINPAYLFVPGGGLLVAAILGFMIGFHATTAMKESFMPDLALYTQDQVINDSGEVS